jgi:hypothetical protein
METTVEAEGRRASDQTTQDPDHDERRVRNLQALIRSSIDTDPWSGLEADRVIGAAFDDEVGAREG